MLKCNYNYNEPTIRYILIYCISYTVFGACNNPKRTSDLNNHQIDSVLTINKVPKALISFTSFPEKREALQAWYTDYPDSLKHKLIMFSQQRKKELIDRELQKRYTYSYNKYTLWDNLLTEQEKDSLRLDRPRHWLNYYDLVHKRKNQFTRYHALTSREVVKWKEEGMVSTAYYDSIAITRWTVDSIKSAKNHLEYLERIKRAKAIIHPIDITYPFGSKSLFYGLNSDSDSRNYTTNGKDEFEMYKPFFRKERDPVSEDIISDRYLPSIKERFDFFGVNSSQKSYIDLGDITSNPTDYFSYRLEDIGNFEVYFYTLLYEIYEDPGDGYLTLYNRGSEQAYTFLGISENNNTYFYIENNTFYLMNNEGNGRLEYLITVDEDEVYITEYPVVNEVFDEKGRIRLDYTMSKAKTNSRTNKLKTYLELNNRLKN